LQATVSAKDDGSPVSTVNAVTSAARANVNNGSGADNGDLKELNPGNIGGHGGGVIES